MTKSLVHPGGHLAGELGALRMSAKELARQIAVPTNRLTQIISGKRGISGDTALRLGRWFGTGPDIWMNLQKKYELRLAELELGDSLKKIPRHRTKPRPPQESRPRRAWPSDRQAPRPPAAPVHSVLCPPNAPERPYHRRAIEADMSYIRNGLIALMMMHSGICVAASCADGVRPDGELIEFSGVLHQELEWGPPNFGENPETDSKFTAWIISLAMPIPVQGGAKMGGKSQPTVSEIRLSVDPTSFNSEALPSLEGKIVVATGKLWNATTPADVTPVVLSVKTVRPTDQPICRIIEEN